MKYILVSLIAFFAIACSNAKKEVMTKTGLISGRAYYKNKFASDSGTLKPLSQKEIFIKLPGESDENYIQKVITDIDGNFYIDIPIRPIVIFAKNMLNIDANTTAIFYGKTDVTANEQQNLQLLSEFDVTKQNGFLFSLKDENAYPAGGATVHVYNSLVNATQNNPAGAIATLTATNEGGIYKINLPAGNYYLNATKTIDTLTFQRLLKQVVVTTTGLTVDTMLLRKKLSVNSVTIVVKDSLNGNVPGARVYLYNNSLLANNDDSSLAVSVQNTDGNGRFSKVDLPAGTYYLNAKKTIGGTLFQRFLKQIFIPASGFVQDTMLIKTSVAVNGFTMIVKDSLNGIIPSANVYLYNSQVLAVSNDPAGAIHVTTSDANGVYSRINLPAGNYFLNATKTVGSIIYSRLAKPIILPPTGFISDTIMVRRSN